MRKILALGCCVLHLALGVVAGTAHVHDADRHHAGSSGLHLDHAHLGETHADPSDGAARLDARHTGDHDGDVLYLSATAIRSIDASIRSMPAIVTVSAMLDPAASMLGRDEARSGQPRDPPRPSRVRPRAPPA